MPKSTEQLKIRNVNLPIAEPAYRKAKKLAVLDHRTPGKLMGMLLEKAIIEYEKIISNSTENRLN